MSKNKPSVWGMVHEINAKAQTINRIFEDEKKELLGLLREELERLQANRRSANNALRLAETGTERYRELERAMKRYRKLEEQGRELWESSRNI
jgi:hypothetical protein